MNELNTLDFFLELKANMDSFIKNKVNSSFNVYLRLGVPLKKEVSFYII